MAVAHVISQVQTKSMSKTETPVWKQSARVFSLSFTVWDGAGWRGKLRDELLVSDGGGVPPREAEVRAVILGRVADCFVDHRTPSLIAYPLESLMKQRVYALALGKGCLNDHELLRHDPLLGRLSGRMEGDTVLAGTSTLNRLELTPDSACRSSHYKTIVAKPELMDDLTVDVFLESHESTPIAENPDSRLTGYSLIPHGTRRARGHRASNPSVHAFCLAPRPSGSPPPPFTAQITNHPTSRQLDVHAHEFRHFAR